MTVLPCFLPIATAVATTSGGLLGADDLEQRHLLHGAEVVHPDHVLGPLRRQRRSCAIGIDDVLEAKMTPGSRVRFDVARAPACFTARSSNTASITRSARCEARVVGRRRDAGRASDPARCGSSASSSRARRGCRRRALSPRLIGSVVAVLRCARAGPAWAAEHVRDARAHEPGAEHEDLFDRRGFTLGRRRRCPSSARSVAKKRSMSRLRHRLTTSSPNALASTSLAASKPSRREGLQHVDDARTAPGSARASSSCTSCAPS